MSIIGASSGSIIQRHSSSSFSKMSYGSQIDPVDHSTAINIGPSINRTGSALSCNEYDNSKNIRRDSSFASLVSEQAQQTLIRARSPHEILSSFHQDMSWALSRGFVASIVAFLVGVHGPKAWFLPLMGGLTMRPIPYQMTNAGDVLLDLGLANELIPKSEVTFPSEKLYFLSLWAPLIIVTVIGGVFPLVASSLPNNNSLHNIHAGVCTICTAIGISEFVTQIFKFYVGRLRPNFYAMCGFDKQTLQCTNGEEMEMEARMSFPSGHSSLSYCGMMVLVLFFIARVGLGRVGKQCSLGRFRVSVLFSFVPLLFSFWCATSRLVDNWHHPSDIIAGSIVGTVAACIAYHVWYPHVFSAYAGIPLSVIIQSQDETTRIGSDYMMVEKSLSLPVVG
ncbi:hypothetical protein ACHAW6_013183 [Cyclotella cf. meneghiniana]